MSEHVLSILVKALGAKTAATDLKSVDTALGKIGAHAKTGLGNAANALKNIGAAGIGVGAIGLAAAVKSATDFEASLNTINTVAQVTPKELDAIGQSIRTVARDTGTSLSDLSQGYYDLVSAGVKAKDATRVLTDANKLAIGGIGSTAEAIDLLTTAINSYGGDASKSGHIADAFAESVAAGKTTVADIAASFAQVGPLASNAGISIDELAAALGVMTAKGTKTPEAITQIRSAIVALISPNAKLLKIQKDTGINFAKMAKQRGLAFAYNELAKAAKKAGVPMVDLTGRVEGALFAAQVAGPEYAKYAAELNRVEHASDGAGVAQAQMNERMKGLKPQLAILRQSLLDMGITIGSKLLPKLTPLVAKLNEFIQGHGQDIEKLGDALASAFGRAADFAGRIPWETVGTSMQIAGTASKAILDAFLGMPSWVQAAVITGWGLNKLTGGALGDIVGEVGKGLIKGVLGMNAGVVNLKAGVVNGGGVGGAAGGLGGATSKLGRVASAVGKVFLVGAAAGAFLELKGILDDQSAANKQGEADLSNKTTAFTQVAGVDDMKRALQGIDDKIYDLNHNITAESFAFSFNIDGVKDAVNAQRQALIAAISKAEGTAAASAVHTTDRMEAIRGVEVQVRDKLESNRVAIQSGAAATAGAVRASAGDTRSELARVRSAINAQDLKVAITNIIPIALKATISARENSSVQISQKRAYSTLI